MPEDHLDDISDLSPDDQAFVRWARRDFERIQAIPPEQRGRLAREKQADAVGMRPDGTLNIVEEPSADDDPA